MKLMSNELSGSPGIEMVPSCRSSAALAAPANADRPTAADSSSFVMIRIGFLRLTHELVDAPNCKSVFFATPGIYINPPLTQLQPVYAGHLSVSLVNCATDNHFTP